LRGFKRLAGLKTEQDKPYQRYPQNPVNPFKSQNKIERIKRWAGLKTEQYKPYQRYPQNPVNPV